jgi:16S rRNA (adenine1518-N6/adenine1519-N6)-dimethyltransferase
MKFNNSESFFDYIKTLRFIASKDLGQNFLINPQTAQKIVENLGAKKGEKVLEIGAGFGSLSYFLVQSEADVFLMDVDPKTIAFLNEQFGDNANVNIVQESILKHDVSKYQKIIGNLPYYITSDTIEHCLLNGFKTTKMVFMIQKEVVQRLTAKTGEDGYGPLSILVSFLGAIKKTINVGRTQFVPIPNVESSVIEINIHENRDYETAQKLNNLTKSLFHHRRKTIRNNLRLLLNDSILADETLSILNVDGAKRPQDLDLTFYLALIKQLKF